MKLRNHGFWSSFIYRGWYLPIVSGHLSSFRTQVWNPCHRTSNSLFSNSIDHSSNHHDHHRHLLDRLMADSRSSCRSRQVVQSSGSGSVRQRSACSHYRWPGDGHNCADGRAILCLVDRGADGWSHCNTTNFHDISYHQTSNVSHTKYQLKCFSSRLAVVFAQSIEARC